MLREARLGDAGDAIVQGLIDSGVSVRTWTANATVQHVQDLLAAARLDVLVFGDVGMHFLPYLVAHGRWAFGCCFRG